jgi:hypothetical protein
MATSSGLSKLFDWVRPHKKHIYYLNEGSMDEKSELASLPSLQSRRVMHTDST